jgi:hypothetical protein
MSEQVDKAAEYVRRIVAGARLEDGHLDDLLRTMTGAELDEAIRRLSDNGELYLEVLRSGARPADLRLALLAAMMTDAERARARAAIGALWLEAEPRPARPN